MTRKEFLAGALATPLVSLVPLPIDRPASIAQAPTLDQLVNLAESGADTKYYSRLLGLYLARWGTIARSNEDGTISVYSPEPKKTWRRWTVADAQRVVPIDLARYFKPANRGEFFPANVPVELLPI